MQRKIIQYRSILDYKNWRGGLLNLARAKIAGNLKNSAFRGKCIAPMWFQLLVGCPGVYIVTVAAKVHPLGWRNVMDLGCEGICLGGWSTHPNAVWEDGSKCY